MKCHRCKYQATLSIEAPCNNCMYNPIGELDCFELKKDEPVSAEILIKDWLGIDDSWLRHTEITVHRDRILDLVKKAEANNELRHRETQSVEDAYEKNRAYIYDQGTFKKGWYSCKKSHKIP